jgi:hypothetical protein
MKFLRHAHVLVVADSDATLLLAGRLARMEWIAVTAVASRDEAGRLCRTGEADACLVAYQEPMPDAPRRPHRDAPGRGLGVPSLLIAPAMTPYLRTYARRAGSAAAAPAGVAPRMLNRRLGAILQRGRAIRRDRRRLAGRLMPLSQRMAVIAKPTLH